MRTGSRIIAVLQFVGLAATLAVSVQLSGAADSGLPSEHMSWPPYAIERVEIYGDYTVRVWRSLDETAPVFCRVVTIDRCGLRLVCEDWVTGLGALSGADIDQSGYPNVIIEGYSGGAHCCFSTIVYDLGETLAEIDLPSSPGGNAPGEFVDLDGDGVMEFRTADDSFAYAYCAFAGSPAVLVILEFSAGERRFVPAGSRYRDLYREDIERDTARAKAALGGCPDGGWDGTGKCEVLPLVLDYLYSGNSEAAWDALELYYPFSDRDLFRAEIEAVVADSPYYAPPAP